MEERELVTADGGDGEKRTETEDGETEARKSERQKNSKTANVGVRRRNWRFSVGLCSVRLAC